MLKPAFTGGIMVAFFLVSGWNYQYLRLQERTLLNMRVQNLKNLTYWKKLQRTVHAFSSCGRQEGAITWSLWTPTEIYLPSFHKRESPIMKYRLPSSCRVGGFNGSLLPVSPCSINWVDFDTQTALIILTEIPPVLKSDLMFIMVRFLPNTT